MYNTILELHSYWAYATLGILVIAILNAFVGMSAKRPFYKKDRQISLIALTFSHIQFLLGLVLLLTNPKWDAVSDMGTLMKNSELRLIFVEHPLVNLIAIVLITIGWSAHKKQTEATAKFKKIGYLYLIGLIFLLSRIPYGQWFA